MEKKITPPGSPVLIYALVVLVGLLILALVLTNTHSLTALGKRRSAIVERAKKTIPVVENYYSKNWDFRARHGDDQILVIAQKGEPLEEFLFRISCSIALAAHMGYSPPLVLVDSTRETDSPSAAKDIPELIQDIFPKLRVMGIPAPSRFVRTQFPEAMFVRGSVKRNGQEAFEEFPEITSRTIVIEGDWESWKYTEDYRQAVFDHLEFHPMIYHYSRKTYPSIHDRKNPVRGIVLGGEFRGEENEAEVRDFVERARTSGEKIIVFSKNPLEKPEIFGENTLVVQGECPQVVIYVAVFCRELLIDSSLLGWWAGMHAYYRGREVSWMGGDESEHFFSPHWRRNKKNE